MAVRFVPRVGPFVWIPTGGRSFIGQVMAASYDLFLLLPLYAIFLTYKWTVIAIGRLIRWSNRQAAVYAANNVPQDWRDKRQDED